MDAESEGKKKAGKQREGEKKQKKGKGARGQRVLMWKETEEMEKKYRRTVGFYNFISIQ